MKDHEKRELVSELVGIARIAHDTEQLRDRIACALSGVFSAIDGVTGRAEKAEEELEQLREQEPVFYYTPQAFGMNTAVVSRTPWTSGMENIPLYATPIPAQAAQVPQDPIATVYIGSGHCKVAFTDAAKEAMKGRQGQSFDVYADPMPRAVKDSLTAESNAAQVPQEWRDVMAELAADLQAACEAEHQHREQYPSIMRKYQNDMAIVERARALLQEVKP